MSVLFQDFVKYELSLRENIGFGDIQNLNNDEKMVQMLHKLQTKFLQTDNGSYNLDLQLGNWFERWMSIVSRTVAENSIRKSLF